MTRTGTSCQTLLSMKQVPIKTSKQIQAKETYAVEVSEELSNYRMNNMQTSKDHFGAATQLKRV